VGRNFEEAETFCRRYSRRWQIEIEFKSIKGDFYSSGLVEALNQ
jgi:IS4 transposase